MQLSEHVDTSACTKAQAKQCLSLDVPKPVLLFVEKHGTTLPFVSPDMQVIEDKQSLFPIEVRIEVEDRDSRRGHNHRRRPRMKGGLMEASTNLHEPFVLLF